MDRQKFGELLNLASRHLAEARQAICHQRELLTAMVEQGENTTEAQALLKQLESSAEAMAQHERSIQEQLLAFKHDPD
jgi:hypothetical protein